MPSKLGIALLGMTFGGITFLITGFAVFLSISQVQDRAMIADARATNGKVAIVHYAQLPPPR